MQSESSSHPPPSATSAWQVPSQWASSSQSASVTHDPGQPGGNWKGPPAQKAETYGPQVLASIEETQALTGRAIERVYVDKGYRGHGVAKPLGVYISGQKRGVHGVIKRELRRRSAIEAVIGHMKTDGHLHRNFLKGRHGDHANAVLSAVGYNFRLILNWLRALSRKILAAILLALKPKSALCPAS